MVKLLPSGAFRARASISTAPGTFRMKGRQDRPLMLSLSPTDSASGSSCSIFSTASTVSLSASSSCSWLPARGKLLLTHMVLPLWPRPARTCRAPSPEKI